MVQRGLDIYGGMVWYGIVLYSVAWISIDAKRGDEIRKVV